MKVDNIRIGNQISENLHLFEEEIKASDLLKIVRYAGNQGRALGSIYDNNKLFYINSEKINRQEFDLIHEKQSHDVNFWLNSNTREDLVNKLGSAIKIVSSTTKEEIISRIVRDKDIIFNHFKKDFVEKYSGKWSSFKSHKVLLPAASEETKKLIFCLGSKQKPLSGKNHQQYWCLGESYHTPDLTRDFKTETVGDTFTLNLKEKDDLILRKINRFLDKSKKDSSLEIHPVYRNIKDDDLQITDSIDIAYGLGIYHLIDYFGFRKGSKFKTFCEGLKNRANPEAVKHYLDRKFLVTTQLDDIYCGIAHDLDLFEKICWHLKIEYLKEKRIVCKVVEQETSETLAILWEIINGDRCWYKFHLIEL